MTESKVLTESEAIKDIFVQIQNRQGPRLSLHEIVYEIYDIINFYDDGTPVRSTRGFILPPISIETIQDVIVRSF